MEILIIASVANIVCFIIGAMVGQRVAKGESIKTPTINPIKAKEERQARKEAVFEHDRIATIMENIERYDGTAYGQKDVPRG